LSTLFSTFQWGSGSDTKNLSFNETSSKDDAAGLPN
jgi:hypothetical protein